MRQGQLSNLQAHYDNLCFCSNNHMLQIMSVSDLKLTTITTITNEKLPFIQWHYILHVHDLDNGGTYWRFHLHRNNIELIKNYGMSMSLICQVKRDFKTDWKAVGVIANLKGPEIIRLSIRQFRMLLTYTDIS